MHQIVVSRSNPATHFLPGGQVIPWAAGAAKGKEVHLDSPPPEELGLPGDEDRRTAPAVPQPVAGYHEHAEPGSHAFLLTGQPDRAGPGRAAGQKVITNAQEKSGPVAEMQGRKYGQERGAAAEAMSSSHPG